LGSNFQAPALKNGGPVPKYGALLLKIALMRLSDAVSVSNFSRAVRSYEALG